MATTKKSAAKRPRTRAAPVKARATKRKKAKPVAAHSTKRRTRPRNDADQLRDLWNMVPEPVRACVRRFVQWMLKLVRALLRLLDRVSGVPPRRAVHVPVGG